MRKANTEIRFLSIAQDDLRDIIDFISIQNTQAAEKLVTRIEKILATLSTHPYAGRISDDEELLRMGYRYLVIDNYLIYYVTEGTQVWIHRIIHGARERKPLLKK
jgi:toxin ParE1/3/4